MLRNGYFFYDNMSMLEAAKSLKLLFDTFTAAGFSDNQALELTKCFITMSKDAGKDKKDDSNSDSGKINVSNSEIEKIISEVTK